MGQGDSAGDFGPSESVENAGILDVFPIFHTARLGQKIRRSPQLPLCGVALRSFALPVAGMVIGTAQQCGKLGFCGVSRQSRLWLEVSLTSFGFDRKIEIIGQHRIMGQKICRIPLSPLCGVAMKIVRCNFGVIVRKKE